MGRHPKPVTPTVLATTFGTRELTLQFRTKSLRCGSRPFRANALSRSRDSPLRRALTVEPSNQGER